MSKSAFRIAAGCAFASAATTFLLWLLPNFYEAPTTFETAVALHKNPVYLARLWVNFVHVLLALVAYGAATSIWSRRSREFAMGGFVAFVFWGMVELLGVAINLIAVNGTWRASYATASPEAQQILRAQITAFPAIWDGLFLIVLVAFLLGTLSHGWVAWNGAGVERWLGLLTLLGAPLTLMILIGGYTSFNQLNGLVDWIYPIIQPISRALLGVFLREEARKADVRGEGSRSV